MEQNHAQLRYLTAIYEISQRKLEVSSVEVARVLNVSKPAVARMLKPLMEQKLIVKKPYGRIYLTDQGIFLARLYRAQRDLIRDKFPDIGLRLGAEDIERAADAAGAALPQERFFERYQALFEQEEPENTQDREEKDQ